MKYIIIFSIYFASSIATSTRTIEKFTRECLIENNLDPDLMYYKNNDASPAPTLVQKGCHLACMNKKMGLMRQNGTFDEDFIISKATTNEVRSNLKKALDKAINECQIEAGNDICKFAYCVNNHPRMMSF